MVAVVTVVAVTLAVATVVTSAVVVVASRAVGLDAPDLLQLLLGVVAFYALLGLVLVTILATGRVGV